MLMRVNDCGLQRRHPSDGGTKSSFVTDCDQSLYLFFSVSPYLRPYKDRFRCGLNVLSFSISIP